MRTLLVSTALVAMSGCNGVSGCPEPYRHDIELDRCVCDPPRVLVDTRCVCPGGMTADVCTEPDAGPLDAGRDGSVDVSIDTPGDVFDSGGCGQIGEACCPSPSPPCIDGANCGLEGCVPCGAPGEQCCERGTPCETLSCLETSLCARVTPLVQVARPGGGTYGVDRHEVTVAQYMDFIEAAPAGTFLTGPGCATNATFEPEPACLAAGFVCTGSECDPLPQVCIDWCDAFAYCAAVGKRLCSSFTSSRLYVSSFGDATVSAWYNACSSGGTYDYATGDNELEMKAKCHFGDLTSAAAADSVTECEAPDASYRGVLSLSGNVREWINACDDTECLAVGGAFADGDFFDANCAFPHGNPPDFANVTTGFRCCEAP